MTKRYNYNDFCQLALLAKEMPTLKRYCEYEYAVKFLFGLLDAQKGKLQSAKSKGATSIKGYEDRIHLIKSIIGFIERERKVPFPIPLQIPEQPSQSTPDAKGDV